MRLLVFFFAEAKWAVAAVFALSTLGAACGIAALALVDRMLAQSRDDLLALLWLFAAFLLVSFVASTAARIGLHAAGHHFVYRLRKKLVKRVLDTDIKELENAGTARLLAMLDGDIRNITIAFVHLPELLFGILLTIAAFIYLLFLSFPLFLTAALWLLVMAAAGLLIVRRIDHYLERMRHDDDFLHADYLAIIGGRKELTLNRHRARLYYGEEFENNARSYQCHVIWADGFNALLYNITNSLVLGLIGVIFYLALGWGLADLGTATICALAILFLRAPLMGAMAGCAALVTAQVSLRKIQSLALADYYSAFNTIATPFTGCQTIALRGVVYRHEAENADAGFVIGPLDFHCRRGEIVFIVGGNGGGKSTLASLLVGLYSPCAGCIEVDGTVLNADDQQAYRHLFSAVLTDFHLFDRLISGMGEEVDSQEADRWLQCFQLDRKVARRHSRLEQTKLSQGQRKRLALLLSIIENRDFIVLDEWAADQDPQFRAFFYRSLLPELRAQGKAIVAVTHDDHFFDVADRIVRMESGRLAEWDQKAMSRRAS